MKLIIKLLCVLACGVIGLSVAVPFISASPVDVTVSRNLMDGGHGTIVLIIAGVGLVASLFGWFFLSALSGAAAFVMFFIEKGLINDILGIKEVDALIKLVTHNGTGYYLLLVGAIALVAFSIVGMIVKKIL
jgi:hypothetical protein